LIAVQLVKAHCQSGCWHGVARAAGIRTADGELDRPPVHIRAQRLFAVGSLSRSARFALPAHGLWKTLDFLRASATLTRMAKKRRIVLAVLLVAAVFAVAIRTAQHHGGWAHKHQLEIAPGGNLAVLKADGSLWVMGPWLPSVGLWFANAGPRLANAGPLSIGHGVIVTHSRLTLLDKERDWVAVASSVSHFLAQC